MSTTSFVAQKLSLCDGLFSLWAVPEKDRDQGGYRSGEMPLGAVERCSLPLSIQATKLEPIIAQALSMLPKELCKIISDYFPVCPNYVERAQLGLFTQHICVSTSNVPKMHVTLMQSSRLSQSAGNITGLVSLFCKAQTPLNIYCSHPNPSTRHEPFLFQLPPISQAENLSHYDALHEGCTIRHLIIPSNAPQAATFLELTLLRRASEARRTPKRKPQESTPEQTQPLKRGHHG